MSLAVLLAAAALLCAILIWPTSRIPLIPAERRATQDHADAELAPPAGPSEVAAAIELLAAALHSGRSVMDCLELVARHQPEVIERAFIRVATALRWGVQPAVAWRAVDPLWGEAAAALQLADRAGVAPTELLLGAAERIRASEQHRLELAGARLAVRIVIPLGLCFLPAFVLLTIVPIVVALTRSLLGAGLS